MLIDFTDCEHLKKTYNGANGQKLCIRYNNKVYMLKFQAIADKTTKMHYKNDCVSEYLGCHIFNMLGVPAQNTLLGYIKLNMKTYYVVACEDLEQNGEQLRDFASLKNQVRDTPRNGKGTDLTEVLAAINEQQLIDPDTLSTYFWTIFMIDALIANWDRHNGNWGFLYNLKTDNFRIAPIWDCGSALYPQLDTETAKLFNNVNEVNARVYEHPTSALTINHKRINYYTFLKENTDTKIQEILVDVVSRVNLTEINKLINDVPLLDDNQKQFLNTVVNKRFDVILKSNIKSSTNHYGITKKMAKYHGIDFNNELQCKKLSELLALK